MKITEIKRHDACVYRLVFPDGKEYIGRCTDLVHEFKEICEYVSCDDGSKATKGIVESLGDWGIHDVDVEILCVVGGKMPSEEEVRVCLEALYRHFRRKFPKSEESRLYKRVCFTRKVMGKRAIVQKTLDGKEVARYDSIKQAVEHTGFSYSCICNAVSGRFSQSNGYLWSYL